MKRSASLPLVIHSLRPVSDVAVAVLGGPRRQRERVAARAGFRQRIGADGVRRSFGRYVRLISSVPQRSSALMTSVFWTSTSTPTDGSTRDNAFDREHRVEERAAGAAEAFRDLDAHHAELEQLVDQRPDIAPARPSRATSGRISVSANS